MQGAHADARAGARFRVRCWGTRGTCPTPGAATVRYGGNTPCIEVRGSDGTLLVLDAGTGIRGLGALMQQEDDESPHRFESGRFGAMPSLRRNSPRPDVLAPSGGTTSSVCMIS